MISSGSQIFDGHNGNAAIFTRENLLNHVLNEFLVEVFSWFAYRVIRIAQSQILSYSLKYFEISYGSLVVRAQVW